MLGNSKCFTEVYHYFKCQTYFRPDEYPKICTVHQLNMHRLQSASSRRLCMEQKGPHSIASSRVKVACQNFEDKMSEFR